jgi:hypothetical protein
METAQSFGRVICACIAETRGLKASKPTMPVTLVVAIVQTNLALLLRIAAQTEERKVGCTRLASAKEAALFQPTV